VGAASVSSVLLCHSVACERISHWPSQTTVSYNKSFTVLQLYQKQQHLKMFMDRQEPRGEKTRPPRENSADVLQRHWLAGSRYSTPSKLGGYLDRLQGQQFGRRIWKIWFHLSICVWPSTGAAFLFDVMRAKKSFAGGVAAVTWVWSWCDSRANPVGQSCCISLLSCSISTVRFCCSTTSDFWTWFLNFCRSIAEKYWILLGSKIWSIPVSIPSGKCMGHTSTNTIKVLPILYCPYFLFRISNTVWCTMAGWLTLWYVQCSAEWCLR